MLILAPNFSISLPASHCGATAVAGIQPAHSQDNFDTIAGAFWHRNHEYPVNDRRHTSAYYWGAGRIVLETVAGLKERGHTVHILSLQAIIRLTSWAYVFIAFPPFRQHGPHFTEVFFRGGAQTGLRRHRYHKTYAHSYASSDWQLGYRWMAEAQTEYSRYYHCNMML